MREGAGTSSGTAAWREFRRTPSRLQAYVGLAVVAACALPFVVPGSLGTQRATWLTVAVLVGISVINVEIGRRLFGGLSRTQQPHKALSAWAFSCAVLLPSPWLLVVVPFTYAHARWRGLRVPLWKWVGSPRSSCSPDWPPAPSRDRWSAPRPTGCRAPAGSACWSGARSARVRGRRERAVRRQRPAQHRRGRGVAAPDAARARRSTSPSWGAARRLPAGAVWTGGPWFVLLLLPIYALAQRAALHVPMRERAEAAASSPRRTRSSSGPTSSRSTWWACSATRSATR